MLIETPLDELLKPFSETIAKERDGAVRARKQSGLEEIWQKARM